MGIVGKVRQAIARVRYGVGVSQSDEMGPSGGYVCVDCRASFDGETDQCPECGCWIVVPAADVAESDARVPWQ